MGLDEPMKSLADIARNIATTADEWSALSVSKRWVRDAETERAKFRKALLFVTVAVLSSDGPLNAYEGLMLNELFGENYVSRADVQLAMGANLLSENLPVLINAIQGFADQGPSYRPDRDPVVTVLNEILD